MSNQTTKLTTQIENGDLKLFGTIMSQSTDLDKRSLLALHDAARKTWGAFVYLEIGSHLGGSLQALVADPACTSIISIDPRPISFGDQRGIVSRYPDNSTVAMRNLLKTVAGSNVEKLQALDSDTERLSPDAIQPKPHFCFIDGEHTDVVALRDARFCLQAMRSDGCIAFHDANVVYSGIQSFLTELEQSGRTFRAYLLPDAVFVVEIGELNLREHASVRRMLEIAWKGYMSALEANQWYRAVLNKPLFRFLRRIRFVRRLFVVKDHVGGQPI